MQVLMQYKTEIRIQSYKYINRYKDILKTIFTQQWHKSTGVCSAQQRIAYSEEGNSRVMFLVCGDTWLNMAFDPNMFCSNEQCNNRLLGCVINHRGIEHWLRLLCWASCWPVCWRQMVSSVASVPASVSSGMAGAVVSLRRDLVGSWSASRHNSVANALAQIRSRKLTLARFKVNIVVYG